MTQCMIYWILFLFSLFGGLSAHARDRWIEATPIEVEVGARGSAGACNCFVWTVTTSIGAGKWETKRFLISSEALFAYARLEHSRLLRGFGETFQAGAAEILWKGGRIGIAFDGVTMGEDVNQGYSDLVRSGLHALASWLISDSASLDVRTGVEYERKRVNLGPEFDEYEAQLRARVRWQGRAFEAEASFLAGADPSDIHESYHLKFEASARYEILELGDVALGIGARGTAEHDDNRDEYGLMGTQLVGVVYMDLAWEPIEARY